MPHHLTVRRTLWPYLIFSPFVKSTVVELTTLQVQKMLSSDKNTDKGDSHSSLKSQHLPEMAIKLDYWVKYCICTLLFYQQVYGPVALHVLEQSHSIEPSFGKGSIVKHALWLKLSSEGLHF